MIFSMFSHVIERDAEIQAKTTAAHREALVFIWLGNFSLWFCAKCETSCPRKTTTTTTYTYSNIIWCCFQNVAWKWHCLRFSTDSVRVRTCENKPQWRWGMGSVLILNHGDEWVIMPASVGAAVAPCVGHFSVWTSCWRHSRSSLR